MTTKLFQNLRNSFASWTQPKASHTGRLKIIAPDLCELNGGCSSTGMFESTPFFLGGGKKNYEFPTPDAMMADIMAEVSSPEYVLPAVESINGGWKVNMGCLRPLDERAIKLPEHLRFARVEAVPVAKAPATLSDIRKMGEYLADEMREDIFKEAIYRFFERDHKILEVDRPLLVPEYRPLAASLHDQLVGTEKQVVEMLAKVFDQFEELREQGHPQFKGASTGQLYQAALGLIAKQLTPILGTIGMWSESFRQQLNPKLAPKLALIRGMLTQNIVLMLTGTLRLDQIADPTEIKQVIETINVSVRDVICPLLIGPFDSGPAVIPMTGALGPLGGHLAFVPWNLLAVLPLIVPIYQHEAGHLRQRIIVGFMETYAKLGEQSIRKAYADGRLKLKMTFKNDASSVFKTADEYLEFIIATVKAQLPERDADGQAMLTGGPGAFGKCFAWYIAGMTALARGTLSDSRGIFRMEAPYSLVKLADGSFGIKPEPHPQDGPRIGSWQAAIADEMGAQKDAQSFLDDAKWLRDIAAAETNNAKIMRWFGQAPEDEESDSVVLKRGVISSIFGALGGLLLRAPRSEKSEKSSKSGKSGKVGTQPSKSKTGSSKPGKSKPSEKSPESGKSDQNGQSGNSGQNTPNGQAGTATSKAPVQPKLPTIEVLWEDYDAAVRIVAHDYLHTPADCLNKMSLMQLVCLTPVRQREKVDVVRDLLLQGKSELPKGFFCFHDVGSGATLALHQAVKNGMTAKAAHELIVGPAEKMMEALLVKWNEDVARLKLFELSAEDVQPVKAAL